MWCCVCIVACLVVVDLFIKWGEILFRDAICALRQVDQSDDVLSLIKLGEAYGLVSACSARTTHHLCLIGACMCEYFPSSIS